MSQTPNRNLRATEARNLLGHTKPRMVTPPPYFLFILSDTDCLGANLGISEHPAEERRRSWGMGASAKERARARRKKDK